MSTYLLDLAGLRIAQENGTELTAASTINFGDGLTASYNAATRSILVENSGGGGASLADYKDSVRAATTGNITLSGPQTIDGVSVIAGQRVLVKNQGVGSENGIYLCAAGAWTRATDFDSGTDVTSLALIPVEEGTVNAGKFFKLTTTGTITLGATSLVFEETIATGTAADFLIHNGVKWVGAKTATQNALATAHTAGLTLDNATAATAIATHQASPEFVVSGNWWDLTGTPASREITWGIGARLHGTDVPGLTIYGTAGATYTGQLVHFGYAQQDAKVVAVFGESAAVEHGTLRGPTGFDMWSRNVAGTGDVRMIRSATAGGLDGLFIGSNTALQGATIVRIRAMNPASNGEITLDSPGTQNAAVAAKWAVTTLGFNAVTRVAVDATNGRLEDGSGNTVASWDANWLLVPRDALAAAYTYGIKLANETDASAGTPLQASPAIVFRGSVWSEALVENYWAAQARHADFSGNERELAFAWSADGTTYTKVLSVIEAGLRFYSGTAATTSTGKLTSLGDTGTTQDRILLEGTGLTHATLRGCDLELRTGSNSGAGGHGRLELHLGGTLAQSLRPFGAGGIGSLFNGDFGGSATIGWLAPTTGIAGRLTEIVGCGGGTGAQNGGDVGVKAGAKSSTGVDGEVYLSDATGAKRLRVNTTGFHLFGGAPVAQPADIVALTDSTTGTADNTVADVGAAFNQATLNNNFADLVAKVNALRTASRTIGAMA